MTVHYHYDKFPPKNIDWFELLDLLEDATSALARYDGLLSGIPNSALLFGPLTTQEAVLSSKIEGTQATMGEVMKFEANGAAEDLSSEKRNDIDEILNYRRTIRFVMRRMKTLPLCQRLVCEAHKVLMHSVRGQNKAPGQYRKIPNWIGPAGCTIENATYIPISADKLTEGMSNWEKYLHSKQKSKLIQMAVLHAEFESLHPFLDGNGRLGRMLIPLFFTNIGLIQSPMFYVSGYFETNKQEYYEKLRGISSSDDWTEWCRFFLKAVISQANANKKKSEDILNLYNVQKDRMPQITHSQHGVVALDMIFRKPVFNMSSFLQSGKIPEATARRILKEFEKIGLILEIKPASGRRPATFAFSELVNITEGYEVFPTK